MNASKKSPIFLQIMLSPRENRRRPAVLPESLLKKCHGRCMGDEGGRRQMAFRGGHSYTICTPANPTDPGDAADPSTPQGILKFSAEYASRYARLRARLSILD